MYKSIIAFVPRYLFMCLLSFGLLFPVGATSLQETVTDILEQKIAEQPDAQQDAFRDMLIGLLTQVADKETTKASTAKLLRGVVILLSDTGSLDTIDNTDSTAISSSEDISAAAMVNALNKERETYCIPVNTEEECGALTLDPQLTALAQSYASYLSENDLFTHNPSASDPAPYRGTGLRERINNIQYNWTSIAENIALGQETVDEVTQAWMGSDGHRKNILGDFTRVGVAKVGNIRVHVFAKQ